MGIQSEAIDAAIIVGAAAIPRAEFDPNRRPVYHPGGLVSRGSALGRFWL
jgi:hypothetical protein